MRIKEHGMRIGYTLWLSAQDTYQWAWGPIGWACSFLSGKRVVVAVDSNGLCDLSINGGRGDQDCPGDELEAIIADHLPARLHHLWPAWE